MRAKKYTLVTGYWSESSFIGSRQWDDPRRDQWLESDHHYKTKFFDYWWQNTIQNCDPYEIIILNAASPNLPAQKKGTWIDLKNNLGHVHDMETTGQTLQLGGWSMSFLLGALFAYNNHSDFVMKGQSCLAFGPWVEAMYQEMDTKNLMMLVGRTTANHYGIEQGLMILRHEFIIPFISMYMGLAYPEGGSGNLQIMQPENKFLVMLQHGLGSQCGFLPFGYGKMRPINFNDPVFYIQRVGPKDLADLSAHGLIRSVGEQ